MSSQKDRDRYNAWYAKNRATRVNKVQYDELWAAWVHLWEAIFTALPSDLAMLILDRADYRTKTNGPFTNRKKPTN